MQQRLFHRSIAFSLAAVLTLAMLGSIDHLAQRDEASPGWAGTVPAATTVASRA